MEVDRDRFLVLVVLVEISGAVWSGLAVGHRGHMPGNAQAGAGFDPDHLGAHIAKLQGAVWSGPHPGEVRDTDTIERSCSHFKSRLSLGVAPIRPAAT